MAKKTKAKKKAAPKKAKAKKVKAKKAAKKKSAPKKKAAKKKKAVAKKKATPKKKTGLAKKKAQVKKAVAKKAVKAVLKKKTGKTTPVKKSPVKKEKSLATKVMEVVDTVKTAISNVVSKSSNSEPNTNSEANSSSEEPFKKHVTSLKEGDPAPFFEGIDQNGTRITSLDFPGKNIVLFFYPEDDTETCTIEACNLRDEYKYLSDNNYAVVGVSPDSVDSHGKFADKYSLPYPLIADTEHKIIKAYDVWGPKQLFGRIYDGLVRTTFIIGFEGNIKKIITDVDAANHAKQITNG